jgi:multidrug resistance protein, MATE family
MLAILTSLILALAGRPIIDFLTTSEPVRAIAYQHLPWAAITAISGCLAFLMDGVFIGAAWSKAMRNRMLLAFAGFGLCLWSLMPLAGNTGLWLSLNLFLFLRGVLLAIAVPKLRAQSFRASQ